MGKEWHVKNIFTFASAIESVRQIVSDGGTVEQIVRDGGSYDIFYSKPTTRLEYLVVKVNLNGVGFVDAPTTTRNESDVTKAINDYVAMGYNLVSQTMYADVVLITFSIEVPLEQ